MNTFHAQVRDRGQLDGDRDGWMTALCDNLARILRGRHAARLLDDGLPDGDFAIIELPTWLWLRPNINVGRKARPRSGEGSLVMPVRIHWVDGPTLHLLQAGDEPKTVAWVATGLGHTGTGRTQIGVGDASEHGDVMDSTPTTILAPLRSRARATAYLRQLVTDGQTARWQALSEMEPRIRWALNTAHVAVSCEVDGIAAHEAPRLLDDVTISSLADLMLLGEGDTPGFVDRLLNLCLDQPKVFAKVDPLKYIVTRTRSEAETVIRRKLGDPHVGRKVRALHRETGGRGDIGELLALYRERYRSDSLAEQRAMAALTVAPSPMARVAPVHFDGYATWHPSLGLAHDEGPSFYDGELIERIDSENMREIGA